MMPDKTMREHVFEYAAEKYGTRPEYLFEKLPDCAVLRHYDNRKWYAIIMSVRRSKFGGGEGTVDVMNVKVGDLTTPVLSVGSDENGNPIAIANANLPDGSYEASVGYKSTQIIDMLFN